MKNPAMTTSTFIIILLGMFSCLQIAESNHRALERQINSTAKEKFDGEPRYGTLRIKKEPMKEKMASRKNLGFREASSSIVLAKLKDRLGRIPWSNSPADASYAGETAGLSQQRLLGIINQLTNDIRVNGRRVTPLQAQIVQQASNGDISPTPSLNDMQNDIVSNVQQAMHGNMQDDMQGNKPNDAMENDAQDSVIKPIHIPLNKAGSSEQAMQPSTFERLMFGGLSQITGVGGGNKGYSEFGGGVTNIPGLSFGGRHNSGVINLMESENGLKPMTGMGGMNGMFTGTNGIHMMGGTGGMSQKMLGGGSYFTKRRGSVSQKKKKNASIDTTSASDKTKSHKVQLVTETHRTRVTKPSIIRLIPAERLTLAGKSPKLKFHQKGKKINPS
ncbi:uncharacterized protein [Montipora foliosa]|uniref:uncharacterized protein n=1 Tax=Montipora foliosa TaxID=591990 RepID=UPI0035F13FA6